jgi:hypothetical protein
VEKEGEGRSNEEERVRERGQERNDMRGKKREKKGSHQETRRGGRMLLKGQRSSGAIRSLSLIRTGDELHHFPVTFVTGSPRKVYEKNRHKFLNGNPGRKQNLGKVLGQELKKGRMFLPSPLQIRDQKDQSRGIGW